MRERERERRTERERDWVKFPRKQTEAENCI